MPTDDKNKDDEFNFSESSEGDEFSFHDDSQGAAEAQDPLQAPQDHEPMSSEDMHAYREPMKEGFDFRGFINRYWRVIAVVAGVLVLFLLVREITKTDNIKPVNVKKKTPVTNNSSQTAEMKSMEDAISNLQQQVATLTKSQQTQVTIQQVKNIVSSFTQLNTEQINELNKKIQNLESHSSSVTVFRPSPEYFISSCDDGRAWVDTKSGFMKTVSVGSTLGNYGVITQIIDPPDANANCQVITQRGPLKYGSNSI
jgi:hypothetical protein